MFDLVIKVLVTAGALWVALQVVPQLQLDAAGDNWWRLLAVGLIIALVNAYLRPIVKALALPISFLTLGLIAFVINAGMLLLAAFVSNELGLGFRIDGFPPNLTADAFVGALLGSIVISVVSTLASLALAPRRLL
jgi:putative membrane protein